MMSNALKGALWSGIICPGLGQIVLKQKKRGIVLMLTAFTGMVIIVVRSAQYAVAILEKIESEGGVIDINAITDAASQASSISGNFICNLGLLIIFFSWIFGIVDAYRIGMKLDREQQSTSQI